MATPAPLGVLATFVSINIATIGIVNSFVLSRYNERASERRAILNAQLSYLQRRALELPRGLSEQSIALLKNEREQTKILTIGSPSRFLTGRLVLLPLAFFLSSFFIFYFMEFGGAIFQGKLQVDANIPGLFAHIFFVVGVLLLIPYVYSLMKLLWSFLRFYTRKKCWGELKWAVPERDEKIITTSFSKEDILKVAVLFKGSVANGFIDTLLVYTDGERDFQIWVPDKLTYLSPVRYDIYGRLHVIGDLGTGILQGRINEVFPLEFRIGKSSHEPKVLDYIWRGELAPVYEDYYIPEKMQIKELKIRMYVDPLHTPRLERDSLDELVIRNSDVLQPEK